MRRCSWHDRPYRGGAGRYDPLKVTYDGFLEVFWRNIDPTTPNRQFAMSDPVPRGIFFHNVISAGSPRSRKSRRPGASAADSDQVRLPPPSIRGGLHQDYYKKNPIRYRNYRAGCGRDRRLEQLWGKAALIPGHGTALRRSSADGLSGPSGG